MVATITVTIDGFTAAGAAKAREHITTAAQSLYEQIMDEYGVGYCHLRCRVSDNDSITYEGGVE